MKDNQPWGMNLNTFCMLMHLSQLSSFVVPGAGIVLPIVMWATNKDEFPLVDQHGREIMNWMLSLFIYSLICIPLMFIIVGFFALFILVLLNLIFAIMGAVNANDGKLWRYPLCIRFFKVDAANQ